MSNFELVDLLGEVSVGEFLERFWEQAPLMIERDDPSMYAGLLDAAAIEDQIAFGNLRPGPGIALLKDGRLAIYEIADPHGQLHQGRVLELYAQGHTIVLYRMERANHSISLLCRNLESTLGFSVRANLYVTPSSSTALDPHWDKHDVMVLQIAGTKHWEVYGSPVELPLASQWKRLEVGSYGTPLLRPILKPGDLLYLPRGVVHRAWTEASDRPGPSVHLTIGLHSYRWLDLAVDSLQDAARDLTELRRGLSPSAMTDPSGEAERRLGELLAQAAGALDVGKRIEEFRVDQVRDLPPNLRGWLTELGGALDVDHETCVRQRTELTALTTGSAGNMRLHFPGHAGDDALTVAPPAETAVRFIVSSNRAPFQVIQLPGQLDPGAKLELVRALLGAGLLTLQTD